MLQIPFAVSKGKQSSMTPAIPLPNAGLVCKACCGLENLSPRDRQRRRRYVPLRNLPRGSCSAQRFDDVGRVP